MYLMISSACVCVLFCVYGYFDPRKSPKYDWVSVHVSHTCVRLWAVAGGSCQ